MRKELVSLGLIATLSFTSYAQAFPLAIPPLSSLAPVAVCVAKKVVPVAVCVTKKVVVVTMTNFAEEKAVEILARKIQASVESFMYSMIVEGKFLSNTGYERNIKGIIGEKIAEIFIRNIKNNKELAKKLEEVLGIKLDSDVNFRIVTETKHVNNRGIDIIACSETKLLVAEVKYGKAMLSSKQKDSKYVKYNINNSKDIISSFCPKTEYKNLYKLLFRIKHISKGVYEIKICPLHKNGNCVSTQIKLTPENLREIKKAISKETLKLVLKVKFNLSREEIDEIMKIFNSINVESLDDLKRVVEKLKATKYFKLILAIMRLGC